MSKADPATAVGADPKKTGVGSVFVSNYPPYSVWRRDLEAEVSRALDEPPRPEADLGLYVHVPFCRRRCKFCYFKVYTDKNSREVQSYLEAVADEIALYADRPAVAGRSLRFVYFGGGTPSFISGKHLQGLVDRLRGVMAWDRVEEVTFECEPGTLTQAKLETIRRVGVTRLSLGVENFSDEVLEENGRAHLSKEIYRVIPWIRELDFDQLNIDLISGMVGETWDNWKDNVRRTIDIAPESVTIYQMELPFNTVYSQRVLDGSAVKVADWETKRAWHLYAFEQLDQAGYDVSSGYTMVRRDGGGRFAYRDALWHGADLLGIGVSSFSHLNGVHYQNVAGFGPYLEKIAAGRRPIDRVHPTSERERLIRELILQMKLGRVKTDYFERKFRTNVLKEFDEPLARLEQRGMLVREPGAIVLTRDGLMRVDQLLPEFYAPEYQNQRYT